MPNENDDLGRTIDQHDYIKALIGPDAEWISGTPAAIPSDRLLIHVSGEPGAWLAPPGAPENFIRCDCGWVPELGEHFRVAGLD